MSIFDCKVMHSICGVFVKSSSSSGDLQSLEKYFSRQVDPRRPWTFLSVAETSICITLHHVCEEVNCEFKALHWWKVNFYNHYSGYSRPSVTLVIKPVEVNLFPLCLYLYKHRTGAYHWLETVGLEINRALLSIHQTGAQRASSTLMLCAASDGVPALAHTIFWVHAKRPTIYSRARFNIIAHWFVTAARLYLACVHF